MTDFTTKVGLPARTWYGVSNYGNWWCGYVQIPEGHVLYGVPYNEDAPDSLAEAVRLVSEGPVGDRGIMDILCMSFRGEDEKFRAGELFDVHGSVTFSGEFGAPLTGFWYGFDCHHYQDDESTQNEAYVMRQCESLAQQILAIGEMAK